MIKNKKTYNIKRKNMEFKKATRNTNFDDFINGAKETEIAKTNKEQEKHR